MCIRDRGSLVGQALALNRLGVRMKRDLPSHLTRDAEEDEPAESEIVGSPGSIGTRDGSDDDRRAEPDDDDHPDYRESDDTTRG